MMEQTVQRKGIEYKKSSATSNKEIREYKVKIKQESGTTNDENFPGFTMVSNQHCAGNDIPGNN